MNFEQILEAIKSLKIQGADAIAKIAILSLANKMQESRAITMEHFINEMNINAQRLKEQRPTEPMLRNELNELICRVEKSGKKNVNELKELIQIEARKIENESIKAKQKIYENALKAMPENGSLLVHCHSSTVIGALINAFKKGKKLRCFCCETRPLYQGTKSARELGAAGIETTLIIDSAANLCMKEKKINAVFVGADAIDWDGALFNKIGTSQIALAAKENGIPIYSVTNALKFDPETKTKPEKIEERNKNEVFYGQRKFDVWNPAFDKTDAKPITAFITQKGVQAPKEFVKAMRKI